MATSMFVAEMTSYIWFYSYVYQPKLSWRSEEFCWARVRDIVLQPSCQSNGGEFTPSSLQLPVVSMGGCFSHEPEVDFEGPGTFSQELQ